jgi:hypothetical protein
MEFSMNAQEVGKKLVELVKAGKSAEAKSELYSKDIVSVEAGAPAGQNRVAQGIDAVKAKGDWWVENHTIHSAEAHGPYPHGDDKFAVRFVYDVTAKHMDNKRFTMDEVAVFHVAESKIVREEFFYSMG